MTDLFTGDLSATTPEIVLTFSGSGFDATRVQDPAVVWNGSEYVMLYGGLPFGNNYQIGFATSPDGITWTKSVFDPVISNSTSQPWDSYRELPTTMMYENGTYELWFNGDNSNLSTDPGYGSGFGFATSTDGVHWTMASANPIRWELNSPNGTGYSLTGVVKFNGQYQAYYESESPSGNVLETAVSTDGANFTGDTKITLPSGYTLEAVTTTTVGSQSYVFGLFQDGSGVDHYGTSTDGTSFTIDGTVNLPSTFAVTSMLIENGTIKFFGSESVGNINWGYGNTDIEYATASLQMPSDQPPTIDLTNSGSCPN